MMTKIKYPYVIIAASCLLHATTDRLHVIFNFTNDDGHDSVINVAFSSCSFVTQQR